MQTDKLVCPECRSDLAEWDTTGSFSLLRCIRCGAWYPVAYDIAMLMARLDDRYTSEVRRYNEIAVTGEHKYTGLQDTKPAFRASVIRNMLVGSDTREFVNIGPGFAPLEEITWGSFAIYSVDEAAQFLYRIRKSYPTVICINAIAEKLPFCNNAFSCLVSDSTFQSVVDRKQFLSEITRVVKPGGMIILTIAYKWNYPRKGQDGFDINTPYELQNLVETVDRLGFDAEYKWMDVHAEKWVEKKEDGNYLYITGVKR